MVGDFLAKGNSAGHRNCISPTIFYSPNKQEIFHSSSKFFTELQTAIWVPWNRNNGRRRPANIPSKVGRKLLLPNTWRENLSKIFLQRGGGGRSFPLAQWWELKSLRPVCRGLGCKTYLWAAAGGHSMAELYGIRWCICWGLCYWHWNRWKIKYRFSANSSTWGNRSRWTKKLHDWIVRKKNLISSKHKLKSTSEQNSHDKYNSVWLISQWSSPSLQKMPFGVGQRGNGAPTCRRAIRWEVHKSVG